MSIPYNLLRLILLFSPLAIYTGARDNFLIKETILIAFSFLAFFIFIIYAYENKIPFYFDKISVAFLIFIFIEALSAINAKFIALTFQTVILHLGLLCSYVLAIQLHHKTKNLFNTFLFVSFAVSVYGILQASGLDLFSWQENFGGRVSSSFGNPNFFAGFLAVSIPIAIGGFLTANNIIKKYLWAALAFLMVLNLFFSGTKGAWVAVFFSLFLILIFLKLYKSKIVIVLCSLLVIFLFGNMFDNKSTSLAERVFKWKTAFEMIKEHPVLGVGAGNLKVNYALYQAKVKKNEPVTLKGTSESNVHNEFLQIWAETGTFGLLAFLAIFFLYARQFFKKPKDALSVCVMSSVAAFLVFCLSNFPLRIIPTAFTLFLFMGLTSGYKQAVTEQKPSITWPIRLIFSAIYITIVWKFAIIPFIADIARANGYKLLSTGNTNSAILQFKKAIDIDRVHSERTAFDLGEIYRNLGLYPQAIEAYKVSVSIRNYGEVYNCIANSYWLIKDYKEALTNWEMAAMLGMPNPEDQKIVERNIKTVKNKLSPLTLPSPSRGR